MKKRFLSLLTVLLFLLSACGGEGSEADTAAPSSSSTGASSLTEASDAFSSRDYEGTYDTANSIAIRLNGSSAACSSDTVQITGSTVTITDKGTYVLSGSLDDGMVVINAEKEDKIQLVLDGASIHSDTSAALYVLQADKVFLTLAEGSENTLSNGGTFTAIDENNIDAAVFSKEDLTINGSGSLTVTSPAGHGIVSKDELTVTGGSITVTSASHGLCGKDSVCITGATLTIDAGRDGIHSENSDDTTLSFIYIESGTFTIDSADDALHSTGTLTVYGGAFTLSSGDDGFHADDALVFHSGSVNVTESYEALEGRSIDILGGEFVLYASDDGLNAAGGHDQSGFGGMRGNDAFGSDPDSFINISNGSLYINAGGDGIDSNGALTISGGSVIVSGANSGDTSILDYGSSGTITGGTFVGTGASMMNVNFSSGTQGSIMVSTGNQSEGTLITLTDTNGTALITREADQAFSCVTISCPGLAEGETYTLTVGSSSYEITLDSLIYNSNGSGGFGGMGTMGGGMGNMGNGNMGGGMGNMGGGNRGGRP